MLMIIHLTQCKDSVSAPTHPRFKAIFAMRPSLTNPNQTAYETENKQTELRTIDSESDQFHTAGDFRLHAVLAGSVESTAKNMIQSGSQPESVS